MHESCDNPLLLIPVTASTSSSGVVAWHVNPVTGEKGMLVFRFRPNMKLCTWWNEVWRENKWISLKDNWKRRVHVMFCDIISLERTSSDTLPARPSLVLNKAESLKSDVNIRWTQLAWAVRWNSSSASWFSVPPEHQFTEKINWACFVQQSRPLRLQRD